MAQREMELNEIRDELTDLTTECGFTLMGDPRDHEQDNLLPPKQPPNMHPQQVLWDVRRHVYYILYSDMRVIKEFRHVFHRDIEDSLVTGKIWTADVRAMTASDEHLFFLCEEWGFRKTSEPLKRAKEDSHGDDSSGDSSLSPVLKQFVCKVDKRSLQQLGRLEMPAHSKEHLFTSRQNISRHWHIAAHSNNLILHVEKTSQLSHFVDGKFHKFICTGSFHKQDTTSISDFQLRDNLLYVGTFDDHILSVYDWTQKDGCKVMIRIPNAKRGNFALLGRSLVVTIWSAVGGNTFNNGENAGKNDECDQSRKEELRFLDVGTKDTFSKPVQLRNFRIMTAASNAKLVMYNLESKELFYQNL